jgi:hypothetical protein
VTPIPIGPGGVGVGPVPGTPPPIGVVGVIHFDVGIFQEFEDTAIQEIVSDAGVVAAVADINTAQTLEARASAVARLMERLE